MGWAVPGAISSGVEGCERDHGRREHHGRQAPRQSAARSDRKTSALHWKVARPSGSRSQLCRFGATSLTQTACGQEEAEGAPRAPPTRPVPGASRRPHSPGSVGWGAAPGQCQPCRGGPHPRGARSAARMGTHASRTTAPRRGPPSGRWAPPPACTRHGRGAPAAGSAPGRRPVSKAGPWGRRRGVGLRAAAAGRLIPAAGRAGRACHTRGRHGGPVGPPRAVPAGGCMRWGWEDWPTLRGEPTPTHTPPQLTAVPVVSSPTCCWEGAPRTLLPPVVWPKGL